MTGVPRGGDVPAQGARHKGTWVALVLLFLATLVVYIPAIRGDYIWDDDYYVTHNDTLTSVEGLGRIWFEVGATVQYYPLVFTTFWLEYRLWELDPTGYHVVNILLHAGSAVLLFFVLRRLSVRAALVAAAVFALHPVHVESVAWITERKNVLSGFFYMSSLLLYLRFAGIGDNDSADKRPWGLYVASLILYGCALLSKTVTCSLPAAILLLLWWKCKRLAASDIVPLLPMFAVGLALGLTTAWVEREHVGATGAMWTFSAFDRLLIAGRALWFYAAKLVWPVGLSFNYAKWHIDDTVWWQYLFPFFASLLVVALWRLRSRIGKGPLVAALLFGGTLFPALGFVDIYPMRFSFVADHFQYLASIAFTTLLVVAASHGMDRFIGRAPARARAGSDAHHGYPGGRVVAATVLVVLAVLTWRQAGVYRNQETLWHDTLKKNPTSWMAHNNLGTFLSDRGRTDEAFDHFESALKLRDDYVLAHKNLGDLLMMRGHLAEAESQFRRANELEPRYADAYSSLGVCLSQQGRLDEAIAALRKSVEVKPGYTAGYINLGLTLAGLRRFEEAVAAYRQAVESNPASAEAYFNMGNALQSLMRTDEAIAAYKNAIRIKPDYADAYFNMGNAYLRLNQREKATNAYQAVLRINSGYAAARQALQALQARP